MALKDFNQLAAEIDQAVHTDGPLGKTTAPGLNAVLRSLAKELTGHAAGGAGLADFDPAAPDGYAAGATVKYVLGGTLRLFAARQALAVAGFAGGQLPPPTGLATDANWQEVSPDTGVQAADLAALVHRTGDESIAGVKTFTDRLDVTAISTTRNELLVQQTGDQLGPISWALRNRIGQNGITLFNQTQNLADIVLQTPSTVAWLRLEGRSNYLFNPDNVRGEFQFFNTTIFRTPNQKVDAFVVLGEKYVGFPNGAKVGIGTTTPSELLEVTGNVKATQFIGDGSRLTGLPGAGAQATTYAQLSALASTSGLRAGQWYVLSDYQLTHVIPNTSDTFTAPAEQLLLLASGPATLAPQGYSITYPTDVVYYSLDNNTSRVPGVTKGFVYRRCDTRLGNDLEIDFRNVRFRRWLDPATNLYSVAADNGQAFRDSEMMPGYADNICFGNTWTGFEPRSSIFNSVNVVADTASRIRYTRVVASKLVGVTLVGEAYLSNFDATNSSLSNVTINRVAFFTQLTGVLLNSSLSNRYQDNAHNNFVLLNSNLSTQALANTVWVNGALYAPGGSGTASSYLQISSTSAARVAEIPVPDACTITAETLDQNATALSYQLDKNTRSGPRQYGASAQSLSQVNAQLAALSAADLAAGVKLYVSTTPAASASPSVVGLTLQ